MGIIDKIIQAMKSFIARIEEMGEVVITQLGIYSEKIATEIRTLMKGAFEKIERGIERIITAFKDKVEQISSRLKAPNVKTGPSIVDKIENLAKDAFKDLGEITKRFGEVAGKFIEKSAVALKNIGSVVETGAVKTFDAVKKIGEETIKKIVEVGSIAVAETRKTSKTLFKNIEIAGEFAFKHEITTAATASISFFDPFLAFSFIVSAGLIMGAVKYEPND